jgi:hypothetical protein
VNGIDTGMFSVAGHSSTAESLYAKVQHANYISIGLNRLAGMTSIMVFIDNREEYKNNLVSIGAEYYKSSVATVVTDEGLITKNRIEVKDFVVGFGHQNSLMKLLWYFECRGEGGFLEYLGDLKKKTAVLKKELIASERFEHFVEFENFVLCDKKDWVEGNVEWHRQLHLKFDKDAPELVSLQWFGGRERLCFVASSVHESFSEGFMRETIGRLEL